MKIIDNLKNEVMWECFAVYRDKEWFKSILNELNSII